MERKPTVLVLMGGPDAEREVSLNSGREVAGALRAFDGGRPFTIVDRVIDKPTIFELKALASECGANVIFPVLHGRWGEGGPLQELLEQLGLPYVGSEPRAAALAMDKMQTKALVTLDDIATPPSQELGATERCAIAPPLVLKPVDDGSSVDLRICRTAGEVDAARRHLHPRCGRLMAEAYVKGRELTVGIALDEPLPIIEIVPAVEYYDYEAKYMRDDTRYIVHPRLPQGVSERCTGIAMTAYRRIDCRDVARVDIMLDGSQPWFLEINTMPGFTTHSLVPMAARKRSGEGGAWSMPELCGRLVRAALDRAGGRLAKSASSASLHHEAV